MVAHRSDDIELLALQQAEQRHFPATVEDDSLVERIVLVELIENKFLSGKVEFFDFGIVIQNITITLAGRRRISELVASKHAKTWVGRLKKSGDWLVGAAGLKVIEWVFKYFSSP